MRTADELLASALGWRQAHYRQFRFCAERDVAWTLQTRLLEAVEREGLPYRAYNDHPILPGSRRGPSADLAIVGGDGHVLLGVEIKYEPSHRRDDILPQKLPVVFWGDDGVGGDVLRVRRFASEGGADRAMSVFIDEGGHFRHLASHEGSAWVSCGDGVWALIARASPSLAGMRARRGSS